MSLPARGSLLPRQQRLSAASRGCLVWLRPCRAESVSNNRLVVGMRESPPPAQREADNAAAPKGARRRTGGEEGEAVCHGRCGGGPGLPRQKESSEPERLWLRL